MDEQLRYRWAPLSHEGLCAEFTAIYLVFIRHLVMRFPFWNPKGPTHFKMESRSRESAQRLLSGFGTVEMPFFRLGRIGVLQSLGPSSDAPRQLLVNSWPP